MSSSNQTIGTDGNIQLLTDIQNLQTLEQGLFNDLESGVANKTLTNSQEQMMINKINQLSQMRTNLYSYLNNYASNNVDQLNSSNNLLSQQKSTVFIIEDQLNQAKSQLQLLENDKYNKLRLVEINTYYGEKYADHTSLMKSITIICIVIIILTILYNQGFLPGSVYTILLIIVVVVSVISLWWKIIYMMNHNNMNYQEYNWYFDPDTAPAIDTTNSSGDNPWVTPDMSTCIGQNCCSSNMTYDTNLNLCVVPSSSSS